MPRAPVVCSPPFRLAPEEQPMISIPTTLLADVAPGGCAAAAAGSATSLVLALGVCVLLGALFWGRRLGSGD